jgi:hypothetical protein
MTMRQVEETALSVVALTMAGVSPNIFPAARRATPAWLTWERTFWSLRSPS